MFGQHATTQSAPPRWPGLLFSAADRKAAPHGIDGVPEIYFTMPEPGPGTQPRHVFQESAWSDIRGRHLVLHRVYCKPSRTVNGRPRPGSLVSFPLNDGEAGPGIASRSTISRFEAAGEGTQDHYLAKGFRYATEQDVAAWAQHYREAKVIEADRLRAVNPATAQERIADLTGKNIGAAVAQVLPGALKAAIAESREQSPQQGKR